MGNIGRRTITRAKAVETHVEATDETREQVKKDIPIVVKKKSNVRNKKYQIRFSEKEFKKISDFANAEDINISDLIRLSLMEKGVL